MINYKGISRARLLSELYNNATNKKTVMGNIKQLDENNMVSIIDHYHDVIGFETYKFDYIGGRPLFVDLDSEEVFDEKRYDLANYYSDDADESILLAEDVVNKIRVEMEDVKSNKKLIK